MQFSFKILLCSKKDRPPVFSFAIQVSDMLLAGAHQAKKLGAQVRNHEYLLQLLPLSLQPQARTHPWLCTSSVFPPPPPILTPFLGRRVSCSFKSQLDTRAPLIQYYCPVLFACAIHRHLGEVSAQRHSAVAAIPADVHKV